MNNDELEAAIYEAFKLRGWIIPTTEAEVAQAEIQMKINPDECEDEDVKRALLKEAEEIIATLPDPEPEVDALKRWLS